MPTAAGQPRERCHEKIPGEHSTAEPPLIIKLGLKQITDTNIPKEGGSKAHIQLSMSSSDSLHLPQTISHLSKTPHEP